MAETGEHEIRPLQKPCGPLLGVGIRRSPAFSNNCLHGNNPGLGEDFLTMQINCNGIVLVFCIPQKCRLMIGMQHTKMRLDLRRSRNREDIEWRK
jgi:hypothetical protein